MAFSDWKASIKPVSGFEAWKSNLEPSSGFDQWKEALPSKDTQQGLFARFGKQMYNAAFAAPVQAVGTESELGKTNTLMNTIGSLGQDVQDRFGRGEPLTQKEVDFWGKVPGWGEVLKRDYEAGVAPIKAEYTTEQRLTRLNTAATKGKELTQRQADVSIHVEAASNLKEKAVDVVAGVGGFIAQLTALKKAYPGLPQAGIWELQNQVNGGKPGMGALQYGAFAVPGKLIKGVTKASEIGRTALQSGAFASVNAVEQMIDEGEIDPVQVLIAAGIPIGLRGAGAVGKRLKSLIKSKNPKVLKALAEEYPETQMPGPDFYVSAGGTTQVVNQTASNIAKAKWANKWAGKNTATLKERMNTLLDKVKGEKNVKKLTALADDMEKLDAELERINPAKLHRASIKKLHSLARKQGVDVPKGTTKTGLKRLLAGPQDVVQTSEGWVVRTGIADSKAGRGWSLDKYSSKAEALEVYLNQQNKLPRAVGRGYKVDISGMKERIRVRAEIGKVGGQTADAILESKLNVTGPGATSIEEATKTLIKQAAGATVLRGTGVKAAIKRLRQTQSARSNAALRKEILGGQTTAGKALRRAKSALGIKAKVPTMTPLELSSAQWEAIDRKIIDVFPLEVRGNDFKRIIAYDGIQKLGRGVVPTDYDFGHISTVLGYDAAVALHSKIAAKKTFTYLDAPRLTRDWLKTLFGYDIQASSVRQTSGIVARHPGISAEATLANVQAYVGTKLIRKGVRTLKRASKADLESGQKAANKINKMIESSEYFEDSTKYVKYLGTTPWASAKAGTKLQQYGDISTFLLGVKGKGPLAKAARTQGAILHASERGANTGINLAMYRLWEVGQKDLQALIKRGKLNPAQVETFKIKRGQEIMNVLKRSSAVTKQGIEIQNAANWVLFSPVQTYSRLIQPIKAITGLAKGKGLRDRTYAAQLMLSNIAKISALSSIGAYVGHRLRASNPAEQPHIDSSNDPTNSLWGKTRVGNDLYDASGGDAPTYRMFARVGLSAYMAGREIITGKEGSSPKAGEVFKRWLNSRETVLLGLGKTLATGKDWLGDDIGLTETFARAFTPEFIASVVEAGVADGTWEQMLEGDIQEASRSLVSNLPLAGFGLLGGGTSTYLEKAASTRYSFKDIIAQKEHGKRWEDLTQVEQIKLSARNKKQLDVLDRRVKAERVDKPVNLSKIQEEQRKSHKKITKLLSPSNKLKAQGTSLSLSRRPRNFYLNDKKWQAYQEGVAKYLNERLTKLNLKDKDDRIKIALVEASMKYAKAKAFNEIRK